MPREHGDRAPVRAPQAEGAVHRGRGDQAASDFDGFCNDTDTCLLGDDSYDYDFDGVPDDCDSCPSDATNDSDGDGSCDISDPCPLDAADDVDGDGICESDDNCPSTTNSAQSDTDGDGIGDSCEPDSDRDGVDDDLDSCPGTAADAVVGLDGCSVAQVCPCDGAWKNHGAYQSCVAQASSELVSDGILSSAERSALVSVAGGNSCGKK